MKLLFAFSLVAACAAVESENILPTPPADAEKSEFQTDVRKMLDILINSLYTNRNIFLRELISNSADAIDKVRFLYLTESHDPVNKDGKAPTMDIYIKANKDTHTLTIRDGGLGMTKEDLGNNLGKIGSSGTKQFLEKFNQAQGDMSLIGQFGVGFYSAFLVADRVVVASKNDASDTQWVWESRADGEYTVYPDPRGNTLGRGTEITLHLKEDADEYLEDNRLRDIVTKYSEFINFPIFLEKEAEEKKDEKKPASTDSDAEEVDADTVEEQPVAEAQNDEPQDGKPKMEWFRVNENRPIWTRDSTTVTEEEYKKFYRVLSKDYEDPLAWDHFNAEGEVEFQSVIFIPATAPAKMFEGASNFASTIKLYVRRVFITDDFKDMLPRYLGFIAGVVDSNDLPLNVSREILQESRILKVIKKKLIRKVLMLIKDLYDRDVVALRDYKDAQDAAEGEEAKTAIAKPELIYPKFWAQYGKALRLGLIDDAANRARLSKLLRYKTTKALGEDEWRSLDEYVAGMLPDQEEIYYIVGFEDNVEALAKKPFIQKFKRVGAEVLLMTDAIDEYVVAHMTDFAGKKLVNLAKEDARLPGLTDAHRRAAQQRAAANTDFVEWYKKVLGNKVEKVIVSERLVDAPAVVASSKHGITANMHAIMRGTPLGEQMSGRASLSKILELNLNHPVVRALREKVRAGETEGAAETAVLLYETALFESGFALDDVKDFITRMQQSIGKSLGVDDFALLEDEETVAEDSNDEEVDADADADADTEESDDTAAASDEL